MDVRHLDEKQTERRRITWTVIAALFFVLYSTLVIHGPTGLFNSPDETANYYFAGRTAETGYPRAQDQFWKAGSGLVHPRAVAVVEGWRVPASFHGLPVVYGIVGSVIGMRALLFLTPLLAVMAFLAWRRVIAVGFGERAGNISGLLLAMMPAWWYFANRGFYHNTFFTSLLIFAAYFFICQPYKKWHVPNAAIAGALVGLALWVRTAEIAWVALAIFALLVAFRKILARSHVIVFLVFAAIAFLPTLAFNQLLYDHPLSTGYRINIQAEARAAHPIDSLDNNTLPNSNYQFLITPFLPFGFHPRTALIHFNRYFVMLPAWTTVATIVGLLWLFHEWRRKRPSQNDLALVVTFFGITGWLALVYGSWVIHDNPDPNAITVGISYSRYWLPAFVLATGVAGAGIGRMAERMERSTRLGAGALCLAAVFILSFSTVFLTTGDGLRDVLSTLRGYAVVKEDVLDRTEPDAVIVADRGDKIFFPERAVIYPLREEATYRTLAALREQHTPLYYYGITLTPEDLHYHNEEQLASFGLLLAPLVTYGDHTLYRFEPS